MIYFFYWQVRRKQTTGTARATVTVSARFYSVSDSSEELMSSPKPTSSITWQCPSLILPPPINRRVTSTRRSKLVCTMTVPPLPHQESPCIPTMSQAAKVSRKCQFPYSRSVPRLPTKTTTSTWTSTPHRLTSAVLNSTPPTPSACRVTTSRHVLRSTPTSVFLSTLPLPWRRRDSVLSPTSPPWRTSTLVTVWRLPLPPTAEVQPDHGVHGNRLD